MFPTGRPFNVCMPLEFENYHESNTYISAIMQCSSCNQSITVLSDQITWKHKFYHADCLINNYINRVDDYASKVSLIFIHRFSMLTSVLTVHLQINLEESESASSNSKPKFKQPRFSSSHTTFGFGSTGETVSNTGKPIFPQSNRLNSGPSTAAQAFQLVQQQLLLPEATAISKLDTTLVTDPIDQE